MNYSTLPQPPLKMQETSETAQSLYEALQQLPDPRRKAGQRSRIAVVREGAVSGQHGRANEPERSHRVGAFAC